MPATRNVEQNSPRKGIAATAIACAAGIATVATVLVVCVNVISQEIAASLDLFMREVAQVESSAMQGAIEDRLSILRGASAFVTDRNLDDDELLIERFREIVESGSFERVGVVTADGRGIGYDSRQGELPAAFYSDRAYVQMALQGEAYVSDPLDDMWGSGMCIVFSVPVYNVKHEGDAPIGALVGISTVDEFADTLDTSLFGGNGYVNIIDSDGNVIFLSGHDESGGEANVFEGPFESADALDEMRGNLAEGVGGSAEFTVDGGSPKMVVYVPVGINDWFAEVVLSADYLEAKNRTVLLASVVMAVFAVGVSGGLLAAVLGTRRRSQRRLEQSALTDLLTGLDNGLAFKRKCSARPEHFDGGFSLVLFNLVGFSLFNTVFGYQEGSALLRSIAAVLSHDVRDGELVARLSDDRFLMLVDSSDIEAAEGRLLGLMDRIDNTLRPEGAQYRIVSQCCVYRLLRTDADRDVNLIVQDMAVPLERAKDDAGVRIVLFDEDDVACAKRARQIENIASTALQKEEFAAYLQPQYDIRGEEPVLCGAEALVRWNSPIIGFVAPDEFIPVLEANGSVRHIDRYMLERVCAQLRSWLDAGLACVPVSVNLSRRNLFSADLVEQIEHVVDAQSIPHHLIKLELTESIVAESEERLANAVEKLHEHGFGISMDDFGTGYSAFPKLKDVPFDAVKLDRSFFGEAIESSRGRTVLLGVIELLERLGFETVAEGVETEKEAAQLKRWGCQVVQGYVFGRPVPAEEFVRDHLAPAQDQLRRR